LDQGGKISDFNFTADSHNITEAISGIVSWVNKDDGYNSSYVHGQVIDHLYQGLGEADGLSTALRLLIHYVGDVHQPLHASTRVNKQYPKGDRGGNDFKIKTHLGVKELHAVWDDVFWEYFHHQATPFSAEDWAAQGKNVSIMVDKWPVDKEKAKNLDPMDWATESYEITTSFVYKGITENTTLPADYVSKGLDICEQRIVLAGNRLATLLQTLDLNVYLPKEKEERVYIPSPKTVITKGQILSNA